MWKSVVDELPPTKSRDYYLCLTEEGYQVVQKYCTHSNIWWDEVGDSGQVIAWRELEKPEFNQFFDKWKVTQKEE